MTNFAKGVAYILDHALAAGCEDRPRIDIIFNNDQEREMFERLFIHMTAAGYIAAVQKAPCKYLIDGAQIQLIGNDQERLAIIHSTIERATAVYHAAKIAKKLRVDQIIAVRDALRDVLQLVGGRS